MTNKIERRTHQPKGSMCYTCEKASADCSNLPFESMPVLSSASDGVLIVRCTERTAKAQGVQS